MRVIAVVVVSIVAGLLPANAQDMKLCTCRANGQDVAFGDHACIRLPSGSYFARCDRVLNNTSWTKVQDGCPSADRGGVPATQG